LSFLVVVGGRACSVIGGRIAVFMSVCPRPKTFPESSANGLYERRVRVVGEEPLEVIDINRGDDFEKARVLGNSFAGYGVIDF
jgi:hypothetical protein